MRQLKIFHRALGLSISSLLVFSGVTFAASPVVVVGGETLNSVNPHNTAETASYDVSTNTLTLEGYSGSSVKVTGSTDNFTIHFSGENTITESGETPALDIETSNCTIKGSDLNSKLTLSTASGPSIKQTGIMTIEDSTNIYIGGKEGIQGERVFVNGGKLDINTEGTAILIDNGELVIGNATASLKSNKSYGIDLRGKSTFTVEGGNITINADLEGISLAAGANAPEDANITFNNGTTTISSRMTPIAILYGHTIPDKAGIKFGDGMFIADDNVLVTTKNNNATYLYTKDGVLAKTVTIKQVTNPNEGNSKTGDNVVAYIMILIACIVALALKFRPTSRF